MIQSTGNVNDPFSKGNFYPQKWGNDTHCALVRKLNARVDRDFLSERRLFHRRKYKNLGPVGFLKKMGIVSLPLNKVGEPTSLPLAYRLGIRTKQIHVLGKI